MPKLARASIDEPRQICKPKKGLKKKVFAIVDSPQKGAYKHPQKCGEWFPAITQKEKIAMDLKITIDVTPSVIAVTERICAAIGLRFTDRRPIAGAENFDSGASEYMDMPKPVPASKDAAEAKPEAAVAISVPEPEPESVAEPEVSPKKRSHRKKADATASEEPAPAPVQPEAAPAPAPAPVQPEATPAPAPVQPEAAPAPAPVQPEAAPAPAPVQPEAAPAHAPVQPEAAPAPAEPVPADTQNAPTIDDVRAVGVKLGAAGKQSVIIDYLKAHGCKSLSQLDPGCYAELIEIGKAAL